MRKISIFICILLLIFLFYKLVIYSGINMHCKYCDNNGSHYHLVPSLTENINHGPKINGKTEHKMCTVCSNNKGKYHHHLLF